MQTACRNWGGIGWHRMSEDLISRMQERLMRRACQKIVLNEWLTKHEMAHLDVIRWRILQGQLRDDLIGDTSPRRMWVTRKGVFIYPPETLDPQHFDTLEKYSGGSRPAGGQ